jgi:hypothetical protein
MKDTNLDELIDAYLKKNITVDQRQQLDQYIQGDPTIKQQLEESKLAYDYLEYLRYKEIRKKLHQADKLYHDQRIKMPVKKTGWLVTLALLTLLISGITLMKRYQAENVAIRYFEYAAGNYSSPAAEYQFSEAEKFFRGHDYSRAASIYSDLLSTYEDPYASWNLIMCELAVEGHTNLMEDKIALIVATGNVKLQDKSRRIISVFKNPVFRWLNPSGTSQLPAIKPRIM